MSNNEKKNGFEKNEINWYCGHYHTDKKIDKIRFMFNDIEEFK